MNRQDNKVNCRSEAKWYDSAGNFIFTQIAQILWGLVELFVTSEQYFALQLITFPLEVNKDNN